MDVTKKFKEDWNEAFPGAVLPDLSFFKSKLAFEKEIVECEQRVDELKLKLRKEEFLLNKLDGIKDDKILFNSIESPVVIAVEQQNNNEALPKDNDSSMGTMNKRNDNDEVFSAKFEVLDIHAGSNSKELSTFSSFKPKSVSKISLSEPPPQSEEIKHLMPEGNVKSHQKSLSMDEKQLNFETPYSSSANRRSTDPSIEEPKPKPRPAPRTLPRGKRGPLPIPPDKNRSLSMTDMSHQNGKGEVPPILLNKTKSMNLEELNLSSKLLEQQSNDIVFKEEKSEIPKIQEKDENKFVDPYMDDEHIYTDIDELNIRRERLPTPPEEHTETPNLERQKMLYVNANMKPKIEKLNDSNDIYDVPSDCESKLQRKRLGSQDRQCIILPDDEENDNNLSSKNTNEVAGKVDTNEFAKEDNSKEIENSEMVFGEDSSFETFEDEDTDDEEHIYANVEDLRLFPKSDDEEDDHDLNDSVMEELSPNYTEITPDQIQSMLQKIREDDIQNSQDESDSDEGSTENIVARNKVFRSRLDSNSEIIRPTSKVVKEPAGRTASSPVKQRKVVEKSPGRSPKTEEEDQEFKASRMRNHLVNNLRDSEKCYLDCMEMLVKFMKPLRVSTESSQPILSVVDFKTIFHKTDEMLKLHQEFFKYLEPRVEHWNDGHLIGDLFTMIMHGFDLYLEYVGNYKSAKDTITKCRNANQQFADIMDQDIRIPSLKDPLKLEGLLYKPVDRVTQYSLILNDLLKYTSPDHPDHPLIVEVSGALFDLFEQVNVDSSKKKRRQRQLLKETSVVEIDDSERRPRSLILFNDVIISAKLKPSTDAYVCKWYASLVDINIKPYANSEKAAVVPVSSKIECDKIRANIANMRQEVRREHMPLQQVISSNDSSPPFIKRRNVQGPRASSRGIEKIKKKIAEQERLLHLISPSTQFNIYHKNGKCYTMLVAVEAERQCWIEALKPRLKRIHARNPPSIQLSSLELQQAFETVLKVQRLGQRFGSQMPSPFLGPTRPISLDFSMFEDDKESLTGYLYVNLHYGKGFTKNSDTYVVLEMDSYGHFFKKAKTKPSRGSDPQWEESFEFEIEACSTLRLSCFNKLRLMGDDISGKCSINLTKENLTDNRNHTLSVCLDRGQSVLNISLCFSTSIDGIKKSPSFSDTGVFGVPIIVVCKREKFCIPVIVISCIKEIEKRGMDELGIYRLSGIASEIQNLKKLFNEQTQNALLALVDTDIHAVAGLLKLYFRELPQSLFTSKLYRKFVEGLSITDSEEKELYMLEMLHQLPKPNKMTALYLFEHLRRIVLLESQNKMGVNNLATVFGPTVLRPPSSNNDKENERSSCNVGTFDIGALDVMSQVGIFRYFLGLKNNERVKLPENDLAFWRRIDPEKASGLEEKLMESAEEHLI